MTVKSEILKNEKWERKQKCFFYIFVECSSAEIAKTHWQHSMFNITVLHGWLIVLLWTSDRNMSHNYTLAAFYVRLRSPIEGYRGDIFYGSLFAAVCCLYPADHFKEICPAGHGYTYSLSDVQISLRRLGEDDLQSTGLSWEEQSPVYPQPPSSHPSLLLPFEPQQPSYPETPQAPQYPEYPETPQAPRLPLTPQQPRRPSEPARETPKPPEGANEFEWAFTRLSLYCHNHAMTPVKNMKESLWMFVSFGQLCDF